MSSLILLKSMLFANALQKKSQKKIKKKNNLTIKNSKGEKVSKVSVFSTDMCRICDQEQGDIPIFNNFIHPNIPEEIQHFADVTINKSDNLSKFMCQSCLDLLNGCIMFKDICQRTNNKLIKLAIKKEANVEPSEICSFVRDHDSDVNDYIEELESICSYCKKSYDDWVSLELHLKKCKMKKVQKSTIAPPGEENKKKFLCDVCGKTAYSNANLIAHMTIHEPIFPFKCDECPYMGRTVDLLKVHKRTHLVDKPFKCPQCPKGTTTASNLAKHIRHVHSSTRPYKCNYCEKAFSFQHDMKRHIKDIHLRQGTVECELCFKKFNTRKILRGHQWKVHKIKGERQGRLPAYLQWQLEAENDNRIVVENQEPVYLM